MKNLFAILIIVLLSSCSSEHSGQCIPSTDSSQTTATGAAKNSPEAIFEYLKDKKIISTVISEIRVRVIGDSGPIGGGGAAETVFTGITSSPSFKSAISAAFTLAIIFYGIGVATGIIQVQLGDALARVGKILVVAFIATNWTLFYQMVGSFFVVTTDEIIFYMLESFGDLYSQGPSFSDGGGINTLTGGEKGNQLFLDMDLFFIQIFSVHTFAIMSALISPFGKNAGPYSNIYAIFLMYAIYQIAQGVLKVVLIYAFSLFAKALLFALAPIFFTFLLFNQTKYLFDAWLKMQISFTLQPIFVMSFLGIFVSTLSPLFGELYSLQVCNVPVDGDMHRWRFTVPESGAAYSSSVSDTPPISLQSLLMLFFFAWMFTAYIKLAEQMATAITQSVLGNLGASASVIAESLNPSGKGGGGGVGSDQLAQAAKASQAKAPVQQRTR